jgi:ferric-dicitrate binding protein FerR (iron transport regulator)
MKSVENLNVLISRYLENKCTAEEKNQLYELLTASDNEKSFKEVIFSHLDEIKDDQYDNNSTVDFERIYNELLSEIKRREIKASEKEMIQKRITVKRMVLVGATIAAVFCIAFFLGTLFKNPSVKGIAGQNIPAGYIEIKAPLGAKSEIRLCDGTEVMLNAGSSIKYSNDYNLLNRSLVLQGEAYFTVARNEDLPLIVNAGNISIKATGTKFNVKAYNEEGIIETTLVDGEVEISQKGNNNNDRVLVLEPSQKAIYASETDQLTLERIKEIEPLAVKPPHIITDKILVSPKTDVEQATAWTKNKLIIRRENLESLCTKLQRKYNVTFVFRDEEIKKYRFSGVLLDETFEQVMDVIKLTAPVDYILDGKTVILISNNKKEEKYSKVTKTKN